MDSRRVSLPGWSGCPESLSRLARFPTPHLAEGSLRPREGLTALLLWMRKPRLRKASDDAPKSAQGWGPEARPPVSHTSAMSPLPCQVKDLSPQYGRSKGDRTLYVGPLVLREEGLASCLCLLNLPTLPPFPAPPAGGAPASRAPPTPTVYASQVNSSFPTAQFPGPTLSPCDSVGLATHSWCLELCVQVSRPGPFVSF